MPVFSSEPSIAPSSGAGFVYDDFPYLLTRIVPGLFHVIPAPVGVDEGSLRSLARFQAACNQLPTCLVLGPRACISVTGDGYEVTADQVPRGGIFVAGALAPSAALEQSDWWEARSHGLLAATEHTRSGYVLGDLTKGGRPATPDELTRLAGFTADGVPVGLVRCSICFEWKGQCLDPSPQFQGQLMTVVCRCANDNHCAWCTAICCVTSSGYQCRAITKTKIDKTHGI